MPRCVPLRGNNWLATLAPRVYPSNRLTPNLLWIRCSRSRTPPRGVLTRRRIRAVMISTMELSTWARTLRGAPGIQTPPPLLGQCLHMALITPQKVVFLRTFRFRWSLLRLLLWRARGLSLRALLTWVMLNTQWRARGPPHQPPLVLIMVAMRGAQPPPEGSSGPHPRHQALIPLQLKPLLLTFHRWQQALP